MKPPFGFLGWELPALTLAKEAREITRWMRAVEDVTWQNPVRDVALRLFDEVVAQRSAIDDLHKVTETASRLAKPTKELTEYLRQWAAFDFSVRHAVDDLFALHPSISTRSMTVTTTGFAAMGALLDAPRLDSILAPLATHIPAQAKGEEGQIQDDLQAFWEDLLKLLAKLPRPTAEFIVSLIIAFYFQYSSSLDMARIDNKVDASTTLERSQTMMIEEIQGRLGTIADQEDSEEETKPGFVATKRMGVRLTANPRSEIIATLYVGQVVQATGEEHEKKSSITFIDFHTGTQMQGWVLTEYLRKLPD